MISARGLGGLAAICWPALSRRRGRTSLGTCRPAQPTAGGPALSGYPCQAATSRGSADCGGYSAGAPDRPDDTEAPLAIPERRSPGPRIEGECFLALQTLLQLISELAVARSPTFEGL